MKHHKKKIKLVLDFITPSLNQLIRSHWSKRRALRIHYAWTIQAALIESGQDISNFKNQKQLIKITSYRKIKLDEDNLIGGAKPLIDALKDVNLIKDDSPDYVKIEYYQIIDKTPKTIIEITNLEAK